MLGNPPGPHCWLFQTLKQRSIMTSFSLLPLVLDWIYIAKTAEALSQVFCTSRFVPEAAPAQQYLITAPSHAYLR